jgi:deoxyribonuclease-1
MPAENFGHHFKCWREKICSKKSGKKYRGRKCCEKTDKNFKRAESELYNLWPSVGLVNAARSNYRYSEISSSKKFYGCNFKVQNRKVEPSDKVKGLVARANLFMSEKYNIKLSKSQKSLFDAWNKKFPPSKREINWAKRVEKVEGYPNPYIKGMQEKVVGGSKALPPKYLSVPGFKKCLSEKSMGTWTSICLPSKMPSPCAIDSWKQLTKMDLPSC